MKVSQRATKEARTATMTDAAAEYPFGAGLARWGVMSGYFGVLNKDGKLVAYRNIAIF